jgi:hypothetical protein
MPRVCIFAHKGHSSNCACIEFFVSASCVLGIHGLVSGFEGLILKTYSMGIILNTVQFITAPEYCFLEGAVTDYS